MANIALWGANYSDVPAVTLPTVGGGTATFYESGGASSWELLAEHDYTVSTTSTSGATVGTIKVGSALQHYDKIVYVRVRDKAGKRPGYFYGSDTFFINTNRANGSTSAWTTAGRLIHRYSTSSVWGQYAGGSTTGYGVYGYSITASGGINVYRRYNSNYSLTIDGTYHVEVYLLDFPDGISPFD